jgi:hypothetical protein
MATYTSFDPLQIPAEATGSVVRTTDAAGVVTETYTLPKQTQLGATGTVTIKGNKVTTHTRPT